MTRFVGVMSAPAVSQPLSVLENCGLISREKGGHHVLHRLSEDALAATLVHFWKSARARAQFRRERKGRARSDSPHKR